MREKKNRKSCVSEMKVALCIKQNPQSKSQDPAERERERERERDVEKEGMSNEVSP